VGVNATRGSASGSPGKTGVGGTDSLDAIILEAVATVRRTVRKCGEGSGRKTARRASQAERSDSLPAEGNPLKVKSPRTAPACNKAGKYQAESKRREGEKP